MPRNRIIFPCEVLYAGPSPGTGFHYGVSADGVPAFASTGVTLNKQLHRVQSASYGFNKSNVDVYQFGQAARIDSINITQPTVPLDFSYLQSNFYNEKTLGLSISTGSLVSVISGFIGKNSDERNLFAKIVSQGQDAISNTDTANNVVFGFGNAHLMSYSAEGSVGDFPRVSVSFEALNMKIDTVTGGAVPAVYPSNGEAVTSMKYSLPTASANAGTGPLAYSTLRPNDINLSLTYTEAGVNVSDWKVQSYSLGFDLSRTNIEKLGSKYAIAKEINLPVTAQFSVTAIVGDISSGNLVDIIKQNSDYDITLTINKPSSTSAGTVNTDTGVALAYIMKSANLEDQSFSLDIGGNKTVTLNFSVPIGGAEQTDAGLFLSGVN